MALARPGPTELLARTVARYVVPLVKPVTVQFSGPTVQVQVAPPGDTVTTYPVTGLVPADDGADQPTVIDWSPGLSPVIDGALGESPKVRALEIVAAPALVVTVKLFVPAVGEIGLVNVRLVPELDSVQSETLMDPIDIAVTPTKKLPLIVTVAPPVLGTRVLSVLLATGV